MISAARARTSSLVDAATNRAIGAVAGEVRNSPLGSGGGPASAADWPEVTRLPVLVSVVGGGGSRSAGGIGCSTLSPDGDGCGVGDPASDFSMRGLPPIHHRFSDE